jgi:Na+-driven multidrug efflux pump
LYKKIKFNKIWSRYSTRVANELGAGNPEGARFSVRVVMTMAAMDAVIVSGTLFVLRRLVGRAYSSEEEVVSFVATMVPLVCTTVVTDGLQGVLSGWFFQEHSQKLPQKLIVAFEHVR